MFIGILRKMSWQFQGMSIGEGTNAPKLLITWHHQVSIGKDCTLEDDIYFKYDGPYQPGPSIIIGNQVFIGRGCEFNIRQQIIIGHNALIASGCKFIDHDHGTNIKSPMNQQIDGVEKPIVIEDDVWLGVNAVILKGVTIGKGSIVGAGAVVTKNIPPFTIAVGIPARPIGLRS
jgi:acetyltransferase-like isoleucine patch superfamily enzyme